MVLHFVSFDFVVWWTSYCWKTSAVNLKKNSDTELPCFSLQWIQLRTSFFLSLRCHGCMDFKLTAWFDFSLELQTGCQFSWQIWWTCTSLFCWEHRTPWLANFILFTDFFFRGDFELLEVFGHCTSIPVELTSWTTSVGKVPSLWGPSTSNWACEEAP